MKIVYTLLALMPLTLVAQSKFAQLDQELPTPNEYRNAAGDPGHHYYQQKADYKINVSINDENQVLKGDEIITYTNNSPDQLDYLWLQLDQNIYSENSDNKMIDIEKMEDFKNIGDVKKKLFYYDGGFKIDEITTVSGQKMKYFINKTMMRIDLAKPLKSKESISFKVKWWYNINDRMAVGGRSGYEYFEKDKN
ncbi:MAG: M1 family peptidase, partial [Fluviicola sp.]|nr:M1 family peptidase [Fluviicola sp.]